MFLRGRIHSQGAELYPQEDYPSPGPKRAGRGQRLGGARPRGRGDTRQR